LIVPVEPTSFEQNGAKSGVFGQRFANTGTPLGPEFRVNGQDASFSGVFGQRYSAIVPFELMSFEVQ
jgi:hypothetical protein